MGKKAAAPRQTIDAPVVSDAEVQAAKAALKDADEKRRQNSNMHYYLACSGKKNAYEALTTAEKKEFFLKWFAKKVSEGKASSTHHEKVAIVNEKGEDWAWWGKETMIRELGEQKALSKIASGSLQHRPDPDTGKDGEFDREYKVYVGKGKSLERGENSHEMRTEADVEKTSRDEALEDIRAAAAYIANDQPATMTVNVKQERPDGEATSAKMTKIAGDIAEHTKTVEALRKNPRQVLRTCGDTITTVKTMWESTQGGKYTEALNADLGRLLPKFKAHYTTIERFVTKSVPVPDDDAVLYAIAKKIDKDYEVYNEYSEWYNKLVAGKAAKKSKKA